MAANSRPSGDGGIWGHLPTIMAATDSRCPKRSVSPPLPPPHLVAGRSRIACSWGARRRPQTRLSRERGRFTSARPPPSQSSPDELNLPSPARASRHQACAGNTRSPGQASVASTSTASITPHAIGHASTLPLPSSPPRIASATAVGVAVAAIEDVLPALSRKKGTSLWDVACRPCSSPRTPRSRYTPPNILPTHPMHRNRGQGSEKGR